MLIVVDGAVMPDKPDPYDVNSINLSDVETVEVLFGANATIYGVGGGHGVLVITTRQGAGLGAKDVQSIGILPITLKGYYKAREFYSPKYDVPVP
jgi:hypothetical protein